MDGIHARHNIHVHVIIVVLVTIHLLIVESGPSVVFNIGGFLLNVSFHDLFKISFIFDNTGFFNENATTGYFLVFNVLHSLMDHILGLFVVPEGVLIRTMMFLFMFLLVIATTHTHF